MSTAGVAQALNITRVFFGIIFLTYASYTDVKTRKVKNEVWMILGFIGGVLLSLQLYLDDMIWEYYLILLPVAFLFGYMVADHEPIFGTEKGAINYKLLFLGILALIALIYQFYLLADDRYFHQLLTIPILIMFFWILYQLNILHGGADAKGLMTISILVPVYPYFSGFPMLRFTPESMAGAMELFFPFAFLVLMNSVIFIIWILVVFLLYNGAKKDFGFPQMFVGYRMGIGDVERKFVWSMERIVEGERVLVLFPKESDHGSLEKLREMGVKKVWVTPKLPYIVALTGGFVLSVFIGNIFGALFGMLG